MKPTRTKQYPEYRIAPYLRRRKPKRHWSEDIRLWRKFELGLGIIAVLALGAAVWGNYQAKDGLEIAQAGLEQARKEAEESRIVNAWQILSNRSPGNIGKKAALETLNNAKEDLQGIDLSCETMDGMDDKNENCDTPTFLAEVSLPNANLIGANLSDADLIGANLSDADLWEANLSDAILLEANLSDADLWEANLSDADLWEANLSDAILFRAILFRANLSDADLWEANLSDAILFRANLSDTDLSEADLSDADLSEADLSDAYLIGANLSDADLFEANLSNVNFCDSFLGCAKKLTQPQIDKAWVWADRPPIFKAGEHQLDRAPPPLCPVELRPEYEANEEIGKPDGC